MSNNEIESKISGLGGWLILFGFIVIIQPLIFLNSLIRDFLPVFNDGTMEILFNNLPELGYFIYFEIFVIFATMIVSFFNIYLFFAKKKLFPKLIIIILLFTLFWIIIDAYIVAVITPNTDFFDEESIIAIITSTMKCVIWVPYVMVSKRVKNTFIN